MSGCRLGEFAVEWLLAGAAQAVWALIRRVICRVIPPDDPRGRSGRSAPTLRPIRPGPLTPREP